ncbi:MAG: MerR family transcriptional regulator [Oscillospiraceae bacterium]|nr:MerR family transcriptional regulator [Oscillospiraceae bacterium]
MKTVAQVSRLTGISVRTLHHYDAIGLLKPSRITDAGYRLYDETALKRLQTILLFRELEFPLKQIKVILESAEFDPMEALTDQIRMLELKREHLDQVIAHARNIQETGVISMNFKAFDTKKMDAYAAQAKEKWGNTDAYRESQQKAAGKTKEQQMETAAELMDIFRQMGQIRQSDPAGAEAQEMVQKLQAFITEHYYNCTKQILMGLGQMYAAGGEMTDNINNAGGEGTAQFAGEAIVHYCK